MGLAAAMASSSTMPKPSCTLGRQKRSARLYSARSWAREMSPSHATVRSSFNSRESRCSAGAHGPSPTIRTSRPGMRPASAPAARSSTSTRLRRYSRPTNSTVNRDGMRRVEFEQAAPLAEIDQLRHDGRELAQTVEFPRAFAGVAAGHQDAGRALHVQPLAARLYGHSEARQPGFEADLVGNDAFQRGDVRRAAGDPIAIHIEADGKIEVRRGTKAPVEPEALQCVHGQPDARGRELDGVAQAFERLCQDVNPDVGAAAALDIERRGSEESDSHLGYAQDYDIRLWGA